MGESNSPIQIPPVLQRRSWRRAIDRWKELAAVDPFGHALWIAAVNLLERPGQYPPSWLRDMLDDIADLVVVALRAQAQMPRPVEIGNQAKVLAEAPQYEAEDRIKIERLRDLMARSGRATPLERIGFPTPELFCAAGVLALHRKVCGVPLNNPNKKRARALCQAIFEAGRVRAELGSTVKHKKLTSWPPHLRRARDDAGHQATVARQVVEAVLESAVAEAEKRAQLYAKALMRHD